MEWIKRNLYFVIGSAIALALMGLAGWYLYSKWDLNNTILGQLDEQYAKLKELNSANPHWGSGEVDNIDLAKKQREQLLSFVDKSRQYFQRIPPIPATESGKVTSQEFSSALSQTMDHLQRDAKEGSVALPPHGEKGQPYSFSFAYQAQNVTFAAGSLEPLSVQLGEVKAISDVLFGAKVNSLEYIRRERVSEDDLKGAAGDYVAEKTFTNEMGVLSPYEVSFKGFSVELAAVLAGFAKSPYGFVVKSVNVEAAAAPATEQTTAAPAQPGYTPPPPQPMPPAEPNRSAGDDFARRYGAGGARPPMPAPQPQQQYVAPRAATAGRGGLPTALDEKQLKITMTVMVVKLNPPAKNPATK